MFGPLSLRLSDLEMWTNKAVETVLKLRTADRFRGMQFAAAFAAYCLILQYISFICRKQGNMFVDA